LKSYLPFALTFLFLAFLFYFVPFKELFQTLSNISLLNFSLALFFYLLSQLLRTLRWSLFLKGYSFKDLFLVNSANIMLNNLLPARTGELSWFYYTKRLGMDFSTSLLTFAVARLYDLTALGFLLSLSLSIELPFLTLFALLVFLLSLFMHKLHILLPSYKKLKDIKEFLGKNINTTLSLMLFLLSLLSQSSKFVSFLFLLSLYQKDLYKLFIAFAGGEISSVLPIHSFMGFGSYELAFSLPLKLLGESLKEWLKLGFTFHSFLLVSSLIFGVPSMLLLSRR